MQIVSNLSLQNFAYLTTIIVAVYQFQVVIIRELWPVANSINME